MTDGPRIWFKAVADKVMSDQDAAAFITPGDRVGMSGFTGSGHPKAFPAALVVVPSMRQRGGSLRCHRLDRLVHRP